MDKRDETTWVIIELTHQGERKIEEGTLAGTIRQDLTVNSDYPIFIPSITYDKNGRSITIHLMEGYAFVASGLPEVLYFRLEDKPYVSSVMSSRGGPNRMRVLSTISNQEVENLRRQLAEQQASDIVENAWVRVVKGKFRGLEGRVLTLSGKKYAYVEFRLRSLVRITPLPRIFLENAEESVEGL